MILQKWNPEIRKYEIFNSPATNISFFTPDLEELKECANCAYELKAGEMYTSRQIHTTIGLGYGVCYDCYKKEL